MAVFPGIFEIFLSVKIPMSRASGQGYPYIQTEMCLSVWKKSPYQTKNDTDLKFGTHTLLDLI